MSQALQCAANKVPGTGEPEVLVQKPQAGLLRFGMETGKAGRKLKAQGSHPESPEKKSSAVGEDN